MKKSKRPKKQKSSTSLDLKKTIQFKLLIAFIVLLFILVVIWVIVYKPNSAEEKGFGLGTLKWDLAENQTKITILDFNKSLDNFTINVNLNWSLGDEINGILIVFERPQGNCNYSISGIDLPAFGQNKTYSILANDSTNTCGPSNFTNLTFVEAYAEIDIPLTQTTVPLPNITIYNGDSLYDLVDQNNAVIDLDDYFSSLVNLNYSVVESPDNDKVDLKINDTTHKLSISIENRDWYGLQKFNLTASEIEGGMDVLNVGTSGTNMSFYVNIVNSTRGPQNTAPEFDAACDDLLWNRNVNYTLNMSKCWTDAENDTLTLRYENRSNNNVTIRASNNILTFVPSHNWVGTGYFYMYADDGTIEESERIDFTVRIPPSTNTTTSGTGTTNTTTNNTYPKIKTSNPSSSSVSLVNGTKTFTITAEKYSTIKWYLNGVSVNWSGLSFDFNNLKDGDVVKVEVINGTKVDSKTWTVNVKADKEDNIIETAQNTSVNLGTIIFYLIILVLVIIILLVVWIFIAEKNKKQNLDISFGTSSSNRKFYK